jgi:GntR family colanic acid and biofilm gene transcriptional regulator
MTTLRHTTLLFETLKISASTITETCVDFPMAPKGGLTGFVERALKQALMAGQLKPGERLVTRELAARLGTSPTPVREALLKLVAAGALETTPSQAFQVPMMSARRYREIADIRRAVEGLAAERAAQAMTPARAAELTAINDRYRAARRAGDVSAALRLNQTFRFTLYDAAEMPTLLALIEGLWLQIGPNLNFLFPRPAGVDLGRHVYDDLLEALQNGDHAAVRRAIELAVDAGTRILLANLDEGGPAATEADRLVAHFP